MSAVYRVPSLAHTSRDARQLARRQTSGLRRAAVGMWLIAGAFVTALLMEHVVEPLVGPIGDPVEFEAQHHEGSEP